VRVLSSVAAFSEALDAARAAGQRVGLVPTMGALHAGHRSLMDRAVSECECVAVTIFVNPLQFGDPWDEAHYPRTLDADLARCEQAGVSVVLAPSVAEMYPSWPEAPATTVRVRGLTDAWEGAARPGHFDGVVTVVAKLFAMAGRCRAYFGEKDFQQLAVVGRLVADLSFPVELVACATVREHDGVALSSRNALLSPSQRQAAPVLAQALAAGRAAMLAGERCPGAVAGAMAEVVAAEPEAELDYAAVVDPVDLTVPAELAPAQPWRLLVAARFGRVRLIDNCEASVPPVPAPRRWGTMDALRTAASWGPAAGEPAGPVGARPAARARRGQVG